MTLAPPAELPGPARLLTRRQEALLLSASTAVDRALQFAIPIVLTRMLTVNDFGQYRIFWLVTLTLSGLAPLGMPRALFYFLPRWNGRARRAYVDNTVIFLVWSGLLCALVVLLTGRLTPLPAAPYLTPAFVFLWIVSSLLDLLPNADQRIRWQAGTMVTLSILRASLVVTAALTGDLAVVFAALLAFVGMKLGVLAYYVGRHYGWRLPRLDRGRLTEQFKYSAPFGIDGALYSLRGNVEHWIVVLLFLPSQYAIFSVTAYLIPLVDIVRGSISNVLLPRMSEQLARGEERGMIAQSIDGSLATGAIVLPVLAFLLVNTEAVLGVLFPSPYAAAAPVMRIYVVALARLILDTTGILMLLQQGRFIMTVSSFVLILAAVCSYLGAHLFGIAGAALGGLVAYYSEAVFSFRRISRLTGLPISRLQDWRGLAAVLGSCVVAAALSHAVLRLMVAQTGVVWGLGISALALAAAYWSALHLLGYGWIPSAVLGRGGWRRAST